MAEKYEDSGFKVVDRRTFATDGTPRDEASKAERTVTNPPEPPPETEPVEIQPPVAAAPFEQERGPDYDLSDEGEPYSGFETLVSYLGTTTMFQLGLMPGPGGERIPADMVNARQTIDMLEVLVEKTQGNLTETEAAMLDDVLYQLRMAYVEVNKHAAARPR